MSALDTGGTGIKEADERVMAKKVRIKMKLFRQPHAAYLIGSAVVWAGLIVATAVLFWGTPHFGEMLPILFVGAVWSLLIVPGNYLPKSARPYVAGPLHSS